ncbi:MAG: UDP-N-acetylmuramoylalanyl-D-glutamate--2,6-diaminopimelate ligase [Sulfurovum sp. PC08-66]|nr:MAG: UDP-N-acetylmuramoylalanyl-D-glutamate--2,6-diaminopimelate ligase [Sulfurovum sp. PC08-66]KIM12582.1 MAG: UDP-N-acetylmuramoylalanyl-D-glutamate--2,6-diaminopimelate ligase [Sulfuricurvum sp. PC08-66]
MRIELEGKPYRYITDNTQEVDDQTALLETAQNRRYIDETLRQKAPTVLKPIDIRSDFGLDRIKIIGITGTNGKTTTAAIIYSILLDLGYKVAMQGTRGFFINDCMVEGKSLTTPLVLQTYTHIYQAVVEECDFFVMEVSSHAIVQERIDGIDFALKILTNITQDHLDFHHTLQEYIAVKNSFFADESMKLINRDEEKAEFNYKNAYSYAVEAGASFKIIAYSLNEGISGAIQFFSEVVPFYSDLHGFFNLHNLTASIAAVKLVTQRPLEEICAQTKNFGGVSGRMEVVSEKPLVIVDFAHTPDGMAKVMDALRETDILVVFGAGGDRDATKRPIMGKIAQTMAKKVYVTSDNPRSEDPDTIIEQIVSGMQNTKGVYTNPNRREAIRQALIDQQEGEVVLILGKGDEAYQEIYDKKLPFDDRSVARELLAQLSNA